MMDQKDSLNKQDEDTNKKINLTQHKIHLITKEKIKDNKYEYTLTKELTKKKIEYIQINYQDLQIKFINLINLLITHNTNQQNIFILCYLENKRIYIYFTELHPDIIQNQQKFNEYTKSIANAISQNDKNYNIYEISQNTPKEINKIINELNNHATKNLQEHSEANINTQTIETESTKTIEIDNTQENQTNTIKSKNENKKNLDEKTIETKERNTIQENLSNTHTSETNNEKIQIQGIDKEKIHHSKITQESLFDTNNSSNKHKEILTSQKESLQSTKDYINKKAYKTNSETKKLKKITLKQEPSVEQSLNHITSVKSIQLKKNPAQDELRTIDIENKKETNPVTLIVNKKAQDINKTKKQSINYKDIKELTQSKIEKQTSTINTSKPNTLGNDTKKDTTDSKKNTSLIQSIYQKLKTIHKKIHQTEEKSQNQELKTNQPQETAKINLNKKEINAPTIEKKIF